MIKSDYKLAISAFACCLLFISSLCNAQPNPSLAVKYSQWGKENKIVGSALSVNGHSFYYGYANKHLSNKVNKDTVFGVGSITKTFVSASLLRLEAERKIKINDKITHYLPQYKNLKDVSIRQLLQMNAGFNDAATSKDDTLSPQQQINQAYKDYNPKRAGHWLYSNVSYQLLGKLIEKITHKTLAQAVSYLLLKPLKMKMSYFPNDNQAKQLIGYQNGIEKISNYGNAYAAGGIVSNIHDLNIFLKALFVDKTLLPETQHHELLSFVGTGSYYAFTKSPIPTFGLGVFKWPISHNRDVLTYTGVLGNGFTTSYIIYNNNIIVIQSNTYNNNNFTLLWVYKPFIKYLINSLNDSVAQFPGPRHLFITQRINHLHSDVFYKRNHPNKFTVG